MRNLKKVLVLVLCFAMILGVMVVGAGAAFSDQSSIDTKHQEAVDACVSLNIINGMPDGSFDPTGNVTREQMSKMICILLNGGKEPTLGAAASSFTDVESSRWSSPFIESCASRGIVAGIGGGKFDPAGNVTGSQAAKMLLVCLGYSQETQKYTGAGWEVNVNTDASAKGFYKELEDIDPTQPLSREHAAQMIWNALNATEVEYQSQLVADANGNLTTKEVVKDRTDIDNDKISLLQDMYGVAIETGILVNVEKNTGKETYTAEVSGVDAFTSVDKDYSNLLGQEVKVMLQKPEKVGEQWSVIGIYPTDNNTVVTAMKGDMDDLDSNKATINGETYKPENNFKNMEAVPVYFTPGVVYEDADGTVGQLADYQTISLIDNDGNGKIDLAICTPVAFAQIKTLTEEDLVFDPIDGDDAIAVDPYEFDIEDGDVDLYDGAAEDDYVIVVNGEFTVDGTGIATPADVVTGTIDAKKGDFTDVKVNSEWYTVVENDETSGLKLNKVFDMAALGTYVFAADKNTSGATAEDVLFVDLAAALTDGVAGKDGKVEAKVYFAEVGSSAKTITISKVYPANDPDNSVTAQEFCTVHYGPMFSLFDSSRLENQMWMFDKDGDDYVLTQLSATETLSFDGYAADNYDSLKDGKATDSSAPAMRVNDSSIVFVKAINGDDSEVKVVNGKTVADWSAKTNVNVAGLYDKENGYNYIQVGAIILGNTSTVPGANTWNYGYVLTKPEIAKTDDGYMYTVNVWDGSSSDVEVTGECVTQSNAGFAKGDFIAYTLDSNDQVDKIVVQTLDDAVYVNAYDDDSVNGFDYADDAAKIGVNVKDTKGAAFKMATADEVPNAIIFYVSDSGVSIMPAADSEIGGIFVASNNKMVPNTTSVNAVPVNITVNPESIAAVTQGQNQNTHGKYDAVITNEGDILPGDTITVEVTCSNIQHTRSGENVALTYDGETITLHFTANGPQEATFTAGDSDGEVAMEYVGTGQAVQIQPL